MRLFTNTPQNISEFNKLMLRLMLPAPENAGISPVFSTHRSMLNKLNTQTKMHLCRISVFARVSNCCICSIFQTNDLWDEICSAAPLCAEPSSQTHLNCLIANPALIPLYISMFIHGITHTVAHQEVAGGRVAGCCAFPS